MQVPSKTVALGAGNLAFVGQVRPGAAIPSWVPANGTIANVSLNTVQSVNAGAGSLFAYSGGVFVPWLGAYGKFFAWGEGHNDGAHNWIFVYDYETQLWSLYKDTASIFNHADDYTADAVTGWMWAATTGTALQIGESSAGHGYGNYTAIPPNVIPNTPLGCLVKMGQSVIPNSGQRSHRRVHLLKIGETLWSDPLGVNLLGNIGAGCSLYDSKRNKVMFIGSDDFHAAYEWYEPGTANSGQTNTTGYLQGYYAIGSYNVHSDLCQVIRGQSSGGVFSFNLQIIDPVSNIVYYPSVIGALPPNAEFDGGVDWDEASQCFIYYGNGISNDVYFIKAPPNPKTDAWVCSKQTVVGNAASNEAGTPGYSRVRYVPSLKSVSWIGGTSRPVNLIGVTLP